LSHYEQTLRRCLVASLVLLLAFPVRAHAVDAGEPSAHPAQAFDQTLYKGVVGNLLDHVPMEAHERLELQRANAVVGNAASARTLAVLLGVSVPALMIGGLLWGIFAASRIKPSGEPPVETLAIVPPAEPSVFPASIELAATQH